jgi:protein CpxP
MISKTSSRGARMAAAAILGAALLAHPTASPAKEPAKRVASAKPVQRGQEVEQRIKTLHQQLRITPEQETAWNTVAQTMRDNAKRLDDLQMQHATDAKTATAPDMIDSYAKTVDTHAEAVHSFRDSFRPLYDSMTADQKKTADGVFRDRVREAEAKRGRS